MRFCLACVAIFSLMVFGLRSCGAEEFMSVTQPGFHQAHRKGGEAQGKRLHRNRQVIRFRSSWQRERHLSVALPRPRPALELLHPERYPRLTPDQGRALADEVFRTPQQIIETAFEAMGWKP